VPVADFLHDPGVEGVAPFVEVGQLELDRPSTLDEVVVTLARRRRRRR
jgi:hypothetical protein